MALTFWNLPASIKSLIYEFDDTYQCKMKEGLSTYVWKASWSLWFKRLECQYCRLVFEHVFERMGMRQFRPIDAHNWYIDWCKSFVFPDKVRISFEYDDVMFNEVRGDLVKVMVENTCLFEGWVLDEYQNKKAMDDLDHWRALDVYEKYVDGVGMLTLWEKQVHRDDGWEDYYDSEDDYNSIGSY